MDKHTEALNQLFDLAEQVAAPKGLSIVDVKFGQAGKRRTLEITIYRKGGGVSLDDCEHMSREMDQIIEERAATANPLVQGAYLLEVQSPGADRQLKTERDFRIFLGRTVLIETKHPVEELGSRFTGTLYGVEAETLTVTKAKSFGLGKKKAALTKEQAEVTLEIKNLSLVKLHLSGLAKLEALDQETGTE